MPLDPQIKEVIDRMTVPGAPALNELTPEQARSRMPVVPVPDDVEPMAAYSDRSIPGPAGNIEIRIYTPAGPGPKPALVYYHGGGWVIGDLDSHDVLCRELCNGSGHSVFSIDYRLDPGNRCQAIQDGKITDPVELATETARCRRHCWHAG